MTDTIRDEQAAREKRKVTLISLAIAMLLIALKLTVGIMTGYLTLITEALHSSLDALVTLITFFAIRYAEKPADRDHPYGHGKAENLAAFTECMLLFFAVGLIIKEVVERLFFKAPQLEPSFWALLVLAVSMMCDVWRSRVLKKAAERYKSPAIEADAVHFRADFVTSSVALCGILVIYLASRWELSRVYTITDIVATCVVLAIVIRMVLRIMARSVNVLLDRTVPSQRALVKELVSKVPNVVGVERIRTREAGKHTFVDLTLDVDRNITVESSEAIRRSAEKTIKEHFGDADVLLQVKPVATRTEGIAERIRAIGAKEGQNLHHIAVHSVEGKLHVDLDLEVTGEMKLADAHALSEKIESLILSDNPDIGDINTHIDWRSDTPAEGTVPVKRRRDGDLLETIERIVRQQKGVLNCTRVFIEEEGPGEIILTVHCTMNAEEGAQNLQRVTEELERVLKAEIAQSKRVVIHIEPEAGV